MADLYNRDIKVIAGPLTISPRTESGATQPVLQIKFSVTATDGSDPNKASLSVWNLNESNRAKLQEKDLEVTIEAGYVGQIREIFKGDIDHTTINRDSVNWVVDLELGDGSKQIKTARINQSARGPQTPGAMLKKAAEALGLDTGNLEEKVRANGARSVLKELLSGFTLSGNASEVLDDVASSLGLKYSVQGKSLLFLSRGEALPGPAVPLSASTGLLGSPSIGENGVVTATSLLNGNLKPGRKVKLDSAVTSGEFVTRKVQHAGETWGQTWTSRVEMVAL